MEHAANELRALDEGEGRPRIATRTLADYFVMTGNANAGITVIRELARTSDPYGRLVAWLSEQADGHVDDQTAEDVFRACQRGGTPADWARLRRLGPADAPTRVLTELELRADWNTFERALRLWDTQALNVPDIRWAAQQLADGIAERHPTRASELYLFAAEAPLTIGKRHIYRSSAALIAKACTLLRAKGLERDAIELASNFRSRHRKRRLLLEALTEQGL